ncbi:uncharacterized protein N7496_003219 [Penicillium cataractarum]|uniref:Uncharacterized protein n=1 Tax=Penicillium cataractarum TaxID=2100454 RepID=A0A9W9SLK1_9EURO|nr:uncharacterized protein N7496_003219 [Penicillium cataractarum]KAJ5380791.1 hypothetical protein N7496_003219 [Penicillium cataractarum]
MLPIPRPSKPGGRKSPFPDPSETKRRRASDSPRPPLSTGNMVMDLRTPVVDRFPGTPETPQERHLPPPAVDLAYQPSGPNQDSMKANRLLGYYRHVPVPWPLNLGYPGYSRYLQPGADTNTDEPSETVPQRGTPTPSPVITHTTNYGQNPTPPHSDPLRTPQRVLPPLPRHYQIPEQPTPPQSDPLRTPEGASWIPPRRHEPSQETTSPLSNPPRPPPQTSMSIRPRQFKVPQKELAVQLVDFEELAAHTAKCDVCDKRNTDGMVRCKPCGWQCCRRCLAERGGDRTHPKAGNLHVPEDAPPTAIARASMTQSYFAPVPKESGREGEKYATPEEEAAAILLKLKNDKRSRVQAGSTSGHTRGSGTIAGPSQPTNRAADGGAEFDSDETEILPDIDTEDETDDDNLPDNLVNVRRNPSRRARPADMKE